MSDRMELIRLEIKNGNEPISTVPDIDSVDLISDETLDRVLADVFDGSYTGMRIENGTYLGGELN